MHGTKKNNGIFGIYHKLKFHDNLPPRREKREDNVLLQNTFECGLSESKGNNQCVGNIDHDRSGSITRPTPLAVTSDAANKKLSGKPVLSNTSASNKFWNVKSPSEFIHKIGTTCRPKVIPKLQVPFKARHVRVFTRNMDLNLYRLGGV